VKTGMEITFEFATWKGPVLWVAAQFLR